MNVLQQWQPQANHFAFNIKVKTGDGKSVMKRVLLDTGSDLNLISHNAYCDLGSNLQRRRCSVRSLAGKASIIGKTQLIWNFLLTPPQTRSRQHDDEFFVLARTEAAAFDCILGHTWIWNHLDCFHDLMQSE
jgi:hypothetical protein